MQRYEIHLVLRNFFEVEALPSGDLLKRKDTQVHPFVRYPLFVADLNEEGTVSAAFTVVESNIIEIFWFLADLGEVNDAIGLLRERRSPTGLLFIIWICFRNDMNGTAFGTTF